MKKIILTIFIGIILFINGQKAEASIDEFLNDNLFKVCNAAFGSETVESLYTTLKLIDKLTCLQVSYNLYYNIMIKEVKGCNLELNNIQINSNINLIETKLKAVKDIALKKYLSSEKIKETAKQMVAGFFKIEYSPSDKPTEISYKKSAEEYLNEVNIILANVIELMNGHVEWAEGHIKEKLNTAYEATRLAGSPGFTIDTY